MGKKKGASTAPTAEATGIGEKKGPRQKNLKRGDVNNERKAKEQNPHQRWK